MSWVEWRNMKIRIKSPKHIDVIQEMLFRIVNVGGISVEMIEKSNSAITQDFRNTKIRINSEEYSKAFQEAVFAAGGKWQHSGEFYRGGINYIFISNSLDMTLCDNAVFFQEHDYKEIQFPLPTNDVYTKHDDTQMKRKVRKDFNLSKEYSVDVSGCTEERKKEVQQAFFDVGIEWRYRGSEYQNLTGVQYTNTTDTGSVSAYLMYSNTTNDCNMTAQEFLDLVYEPENKGHVHAELMAQYAEDAKTHDEPWKLWECRAFNSKWTPVVKCLLWFPHVEYRHKPKTHTVNGVEIPDLRINPKLGQEYWHPDASIEEFVWGTVYGYDQSTDSHRLANNLCYEPTEEGKQAAILHAAAWLGIA